MKMQKKIITLAMSALLLVSVFVGVFSVNAEADNPTSSQETTTIGGFEVTGGGCQVPIML